MILPFFFIYWKFNVLIFYDKNVLKYNINLLKNDMKPVMIKI